MLDINFDNLDPSQTKIEITKGARNQFILMLENDFTLKDKLIRVQIGGKGCDGFTYQVGFDQKKANDYAFEEDGLTIVMQPFTAYFCQDISIDYLIDSQSHEDGFLITNHNQESFKGKFFKTET